MSGSETRSEYYFSADQNVKCPECGDVITKATIVQDIFLHDPDGFVAGGMFFPSEYPQEIPVLKEFRVDPCGCLLPPDTVIEIKESAK